MTASTTALIICGVLLALAAVTSTLNPFFRKISGRGDSDTTESSNNNEDSNRQYPSVSIVIPAHDDAEKLATHLPKFLSQDYHGPFEVIVVADKGDYDTENVLKRYANDQHFYYTLMPESSRYISRRKLAISIGAKAAKYDWCLLVNPESCPQSDSWLNAMASAMLPGTDIVEGISDYTTGTKSYYRFERFHTMNYIIREDRRSVAYRSCGTNLAFRKKMFLYDGDGFLGNLNLVRGEYDFIVNKYAKAGNTAFVTRPEAMVLDEAPTRKVWRSSHIFYLETRKQLLRSASHRLAFNLDQTALHINYIADITAIVLSAYMSWWIVLAASSLSLLLTMTFRTIIARKRFRILGFSMSLWLSLLYEISVTWHNAGLFIRYKCADKLEFTTHKI